MALEELQKHPKYYLTGCPYPTIQAGDTLFKFHWPSLQIHAKILESMGDLPQHNGAPMKLQNITADTFEAILDWLIGERWQPKQLPLRIHIKMLRVSSYLMILLVNHQKSCGKKKTHQHLSATEKLKALKAKAMGKMKAHSQVSLSSSSSSLFQAAKTESDSVFRNKKRKTSMNLTEASSSSKTSHYGVTHEGLVVSTIAITLWTLTHEHVTKPGQSCRLAVVNEKDGIHIPCDLDHQGLLELVRKHLPDVMRYLRACKPILNSAFNANIDDPSEQWFSPITLCLKEDRHYAAFPGKEGSFPTGTVIRENCASRSKISWEDNKIIFCAHVDPAVDLTEVAENSWMVGKFPSPDLPYISEDSDAEGEEGLDSSEKQNIQAPHLPKHRHLFLPSSSGDEDKEVEWVHGTESENGSDEDGGSPGTSKAVTRRAGHIFKNYANQRTTRSMARANVSTPHSEPVPLKPSNSVEAIPEDEEDEDSIASSIVVADPATSPVRREPAVKVKSASFLINDKLENDAYTIFIPKV
ncbi:hypothetical protein D9757_015059 [Collybiopsis confluens]|uniref:Uncharacterized protein n=1 Tax=Collybiopsis confluens TaxID=2823264 RepID=A0A8H5LNU3_9AGAR|nr:hypothetical protein D9757_015059 [Collybiopsis confluens]